MENVVTESAEASEAPRNRSSLVKIVVVLAVIAGLFALSRAVPIQEILTNTLERIESLGWVGYLIFIVMYVAACVFFIPGSVLTLGAGAIYGLVEGFVLVSVASTLGATAAFLVGRYLARDWVASKVEGNAKFKAIDDAVAKEGWKIVGLTRLSPAFPFSLLNYAYGLTRVSLPHYFFASWIGMMPGTVLYVYFGSLAGDLAALGTESAPEDSTGRLVFQIVGLIATIAVTVYVTRIASRALKTQTGEATE